MTTNLTTPLTLTQAAAEVGKAPATLRDWIRKGYLHPTRINTGHGRTRLYVTGQQVREAEHTAWTNTHKPRRTHPA